MKPGRIALVGDLHGAWDAWDVRFFNESDYELLLFTGDLGSGTLDNGLKVAKAIARLAKPALVMPGNNDAEHVPALKAEFGHQQGLIKVLKQAGAEASPSLTAASGRVEVCGFSLHTVEIAGRNVNLLAARPMAMGGGALSFSDQIERLYGINSIEQSAARLKSMVDECEHNEVIFLAHQGPTGLGEQATDLWGRDFHTDEGDWGDPDLREAIEHARKRGKRVLAVIAGHMHLRTRSGADRAWQCEMDEVLYINPARVPRIWPTADNMLRHHAVLEIDGNDVRCLEVQVPEYDQ